MVVRLSRLKPPKPHRLAGFTQKSTGATFQQLTRGLGTGERAVKPQGVAPFSGPNARALKQRYGMYDAQAQGWIAAALGNAWVRSKMSGNTGTSPELVVVGRYLSRGYVMHRTLFFQEVALKGFRLDRVFVSDVAISRAGTLILLPIDGHFFHSRTLKQQLDAQRRNAALASLGRVVVVPDTETLSGARLNTFLMRKGVA